MFLLRLKLARNGHIKDSADWKSICKKYPLRAIQLIEAQVSVWNINQEHKARNENLYNHDIEALNKAIEKHPQEAWDLFIPHIKRLTSFKVTQENYSKFKKWQEGGFRGSGITLTRGVVEFAIKAGKNLAAKQPDILFKQTWSLENSNSPVLQEILMLVYTELPPLYADKGIMWLLNDTSRFRLELGYHYEEAEWMPTARLIKALSSHCSYELFQRLETAITYYHSPDEKRLAEYCLKGWKEGFVDHYWGQTQYFLLPALCEKRVSPETINLIKVLRRKFADYPKHRFLIMGEHKGGMVGSKLHKNIDKISDRAWLAIISNKKLLENRIDRWSSWIQEGGNVFESSVEQFSRSLQIIAKRFPERFGQLALQFPDDVHPRYVWAILEGIGKKKPDNEVPEESKRNWQPARIETVEAVLDKFQTGDDYATASAFCSLISDRAKKDWSDKVVERLVSYAAKHSNPNLGKLNIYSNNDNDIKKATVDTLFQNTINCVRGKAAIATGQLLWEHKDWFGTLTPAIESLVNDQHPAVRMAVIDVLLPVINVNKNLAVTWFCKACKDDSRVAASPRAREFFNYTVQSHIKQLGPLIQQMMNSSFEEVAEKGAEEVTARWLLYGFFEQELQECLQGTVPLRKGIAQIASQLIYKNEYLMKCQELLLQLFDDPDKDVRRKTLSIFWGRNSIKISDHKEFLVKFIRSRAFADDPDRFVGLLEDYTDSLLPFSEIIFNVFDVFATQLQEESRDLSSTISYTVSKASPLLLRLYDQAQVKRKKDLEIRCLDMWDLLFENRVGNVRGLTSAIEK